MDRPTCFNIEAAVFLFVLIDVAFWEGVENNVFNFPIESYYSKISLILIKEKVKDLLALLQTTN